MNKNRDSRLDLIRTVAIISVISVHFLFYCGYYETILSGKRMFVMTFMRTIFLNCVPLFIMLTGYLNSKKELTRSYYYGGLKILRTYLLVCGCCILFKIFYLNEELTFLGIVTSIFNFSAAPYAWYVNMYISLFLLIPFLNVLYNGLETRYMKKILIGTFLVVTVLPSINIKYNILPDWWVRLYPITYYYLGTYLREYGCDIKKRNLMICLLGALFIFTAFNFYYDYGAVFTERAFSSYNGFECAVLAPVIFMLCLSVKTDDIPCSIRTVLGVISKCAFGMYLSSWILDAVVYEMLKNTVSTVVLRLNYAPIVILIVFIGSFLISYLLLEFEKILERFGSYINCLKKV